MLSVTQRMRPAAYDVAGLLALAFLLPELVEGVDPLSLLDPDSPLLEVAPDDEDSEVEDELAELDAEPDASLLALPPLLEPYPSAYQPPPFSKKPVPPDTCRLAVAFLHLGQSLSGSALIGCSASH
jgi:hypothetical protein